MLKSGEEYTYTVTTNEISLYVGENRRHGGIRDKISGMTARSSSALRHFINAAVFTRYRFVTLTYRYNQQEWVAAYSDLRNWYKRLVYVSGPFCAVWKQELQTRGAIHFHTFLLEYPLPMTKALLRDTWLDVTGQRGDIAARKYGIMEFTVSDLRTKEVGVMLSYLVKYTSKTESPTVGKSWGILGRKHAQEHRRSIKLAKVLAEEVMDTIVAGGGRVMDAPGGGRYVHLYLGRIGGEGPETAATGVAAQISDLLVEGLSQVVV